MGPLKLNKLQLGLGLLAVLSVLHIIYLFRTSLSLAGRDFLYLTRPIWDSPATPPNITTHFYAPSLPLAKRCAMHGWRVRKKQPRVIDAILFSNELDMLEIRMKELWDVVDTFVIVESDKTFTGSRKPLFFNQSQDKFSWAKAKLVHFILTTLLSTDPTGRFENEGKSRGAMTKLVKSLNPNRGDLIIAGDTDELPYRHTIQLLRSCQGYPPELHLELQDYLYSFEFRHHGKNSKPHVNTILDPSDYFYHHQWAPGSEALADSGWHCTFCFRNISEFVFKMTSYSHSDRVTKPELLDKDSIQRRICEGSNIFGMLPEAYSFKQLVTEWGSIPKTASTFGLPEYIVQNPTKFRYLLPGGCVREDSQQQHN